MKTKILDKHKGLVGTVTPDGTVLDRLNGKAGTISDNGLVRDRLGMKLGMVETDGTLRNRQGQRVGKFENQAPDYKVRRLTGVLEGYVRELGDIDPQYAAGAALVLLLTPKSR